MSSDHQQTRRTAPVAPPVRRARLRRWRRSWQQFNLLAQLGFVIIGLVVLVAVSARVAAPFDPFEMNVVRSLEPPSAEHWFGTDHFGRDLVSRIMLGTRLSMYIGLTSTGIALAVGASLGLMAGFLGRAVDQVLSRVMDVLFSFPPLLLAIAIAGTLGPSTRNAIAAISIVYAPFFFRIARAPVLVEKEKEYVLAARAIGARTSRIVARHALPNVLAPIMVQTAVTLAYALLAEAALSYLGLGPQPPNPSWGLMLSEGRQFLLQAPWIAVFPGLAIMVFVFAANLVGDGLRDVLDPMGHTRIGRAAAGP
jgi:peptide/nickel transport system permease protein